MGGSRREGGRRTTRPVLPARAADVIVVVNFVKWMVDSMEKLESQWFGSCGYLYDSVRGGMLPELP